MIDLKGISKILWGDRVYFPNMRDDRDEPLPDDGRTKGDVHIGGSGTGKTTALANHTVDYLLRHPDYAMFSLDPSGAFTDAFLSLWPPEYMNRIVYDEPGNPDLVVPMPEFSPLYGVPDEENVQRVAENLRKLAPHLITQTPVVGGLPLIELAPEIFRLCTVIRNEHDESFQVTEVKRLLAEKTYLVNALKNHGQKAPSSLPDS